MAKNVYTLFKGALKFGVPYLHSYNGDHHYVIVVDDGNDGLFRIVANVKSDSSQDGPDGYDVLCTWSQFFDHPMVPALKPFQWGLRNQDSRNSITCTTHDCLTSAARGPLLSILMTRQMTSMMSWTVCCDSTAVPSR